MKKFFLLFAVMLCSMAGFAQKDTKAVGVHVAYGSEIKNLGVGIRGQYFYTDNVRFEGSFNKFFKKDGVSAWDLSANAQYVIGLGEKVNVYPFVGLTFANWTTEHKTILDQATGSYELKNDSHPRFGANFGLGLEYNLSGSTFATLEVRDQVVSDYNQVVVSLGIGYRF